MPGVLGQRGSTEARKLIACLRRRLGTAVVASILVLRCQHPLAQAPEPAVAPPLHDLGGVAGLRERFETDRETTRIVLLLSPT